MHDQSDSIKIMHDIGSALYLAWTPRAWITPRTVALGNESAIDDLQRRGQQVLIRDPNEAAIDLSRSLRPAMCRAGADRTVSSIAGWPLRSYRCEITKPRSVINALPEAGHCRKALPEAGYQGIGDQRIAGNQCSPSNFRKR